MTDLERFVALYASFGINVLVNILEDGRKYIVLGDGHTAGADIGVTASSKFEGYPGFYSDVTFTPDGWFESQGFAE